MKRILTISLVLCLTSLACTNMSQTNIKTNKKKLPPELYIKKLDSLGYFKMTPENELDSSKAYLISAYQDFNFFDGKLFYDSIYNVDYRFYVLDGEELYEEGGLTSYLNDLNRTFIKLGITMNYDKEFVRLSTDSLCHTIEINGSKHIAYDGVYSEYSWGIAAYKFADMINTELEKQGVNERVYLISSGNDGRLVFLTKEIYKFVRNVNPIDDESPMEIREWAKYHSFEKYV